MSRCQNRAGGAQCDRRDGHEGKCVVGQVMLSDFGEVEFIRGEAALKDEIVRVAMLGNPLDGNWLISLYNACESLRAFRAKRGRAE